jgi:hypothetical protein
MEPRTNAEADHVIRRYLLGAADPEVCDRIEERLFSDDRIFWERLCLAEDELIDDYVQEALDSEEREAFERWFLATDERRAKLEGARALLAYVEQQPSGRRPQPLLSRRIGTPFWAVAAAAALLLVTPAAIWRLTPGPGQTAEITATLSRSDLLRDESGQLARVYISSTTTLIRLHLLVGDTHERYRATLHEAAGLEVWSQARLAVKTIDGRPAVTLVLPAELLSEGDYYVVLRDAADGGSTAGGDRYAFRLLRQ